MHSIHLVIPKIVEPLKLWRQDFGFSADTPVFSDFLQNIKQTKMQYSGFDRTLFSLLGLLTDVELPVARYRFASASQAASHFADNDQITTKLETGEFTLVCADPVHCEVGLNDITLTEIIEDLSDDESDELIVLLNEYFAEDEMHFFRDQANAWYLLLPHRLKLETTPLDEVFRKNIYLHLPKIVATIDSTDKSLRSWQAIQNEIQMLLHSASINHVREMSGLPSINSLWFWGGGETFKKQTSFNCVYGGGVRGQSIAMAAQSKWLELPGSGQNILESFQTDHKQSSSGEANLVILDQLFEPALHDDMTSWQRNITQIEQNMIEPLLQSWRSGELEIQIHTCSGLSVKPVKPSGWNRWINKFFKNKTADSLLSLLDSKP